MKKRKFLSIVIVFAMVLSIMPAGALTAYGDSAESNYSIILERLAPLLDSPDDLFAAKDMLEAVKDNNYDDEIEDALDGLSDEAINILIANGFIEKDGDTLYYDNLADVLDAVNDVIDGKGDYSGANVYNILLDIKSDGETLSAETKEEIKAAYTYIYNSLPVQAQEDFEKYGDTVSERADILIDLIKEAYITGDTLVRIVNDYIEFSIYDDYVVSANKVLKKRVKEGYSPIVLNEYHEEAIYVILDIIGDKLTAYAVQNTDDERDVYDEFAMVFEKLKILSFDIDELDMSPKTILTTKDSFDIIVEADEFYVPEYNDIVQESEVKMTLVSDTETEIAATIEQSDFDNGLYIKGHFDKALEAGTYSVYIELRDDKLLLERYDDDFELTCKKPSGGGGGSDPVDPAEPSDPTSGPVTEVGDDSIDTEVKEVDGQQVADVSVDNDAIKNAIEESEEGTTVVIAVDEDADVVQAGFGGDIIALMEKSDISISIKTETASYSVPAKDLNISTLAKELGEGVKTEDVKISVVIAQPTEDKIKVVQDQAAKAGVQLVIPPIEFDVVATSGEKSIKISKFNRFVERSIKVPEGVDHKTITTAVVQDKEGNLTPVPTEVVKIDGAYYVKIKSMTNSIYTVINNNKQFADVASHWAKDDVNDMGSRLIINGVSDTAFEPDRDITRAEFMTIVVRALGIMRSGEGTDAFDDINADDWYYDAVSIAKSYGLTNGNGDGTFTPNSKITREAAMTIISRAMKMAGMETEISDSEISTQLSAFVDSVNISGWAKESVAVCVKNDIVGGYDGKIFAKNNITRAECAAIVKRMLVKANLID